MQYLSPYPGNKKRLIFEKEEKELLHAIHAKLDAKKVLKAAKKLQSVKLHWLKARRQALDISRREDKLEEKRLKNIEKETELWVHRTLDSIIEEYKTKKM